MSCTALKCTALHWTALHWTTLRNRKLSATDSVMSFFSKLDWRTEHLAGLPGRADYQLVTVYSPLVWIQKKFVN